MHNSATELLDKLQMLKNENKNRGKVYVRKFVYEQLLNMEIGTHSDSFFNDLKIGGYKIMIKHDSFFQKNKSFILYPEYSKPKIDYNTIFNKKYKMSTTASTNSIKYDEHTFKFKTK